MTALALLDLAPDFVRAHSAPLVVVTPMLASALAALTPSARAAWSVALGASVMSLAFASVLMAQVWTDGVISYPMGGWAPPLGIEYRVDPLNAMFVLLVAAFAVICLVYAPKSVDAEIEPRKRALFYSVFLVCVTGLLGVAITGDAFNIFVFLEISSLSTYVLVAMGAQRDRRALTAAYNYLILGTIGATFFVIGIGFLYAATGTLNLVDLSERLGPLSDTTTVRAGFAFVIIGLGLKIAMFPLHTWLPSAYTFAPSFVTAFLAATATKVAFYALVRFLYSVFDPSFSFQGQALLFLLAPLAVVGMIAGSFQAVFQNDIRRLFALSSVAQVGYMLLGVSFGTAAGLTAGLLHLGNHAFLKAALFMAIGAAALRLGATRVQDFAGLGRVMPFTMAAFTVAGLSLIGVPLTAGFVSKWYLLEAAFDRGWWWAAAAIAVSSVLALVYVGRILETAYLRPPPTRDGAPLGQLAAPLSMLLPLWVLSALTIWFGVDAELPTSLTCRAAEFLTGDLAAICADVGGAP